MSSETGVLEIEPKNVKFHGRLEPGKMFLVNMDEGRIVNDEEIKEQIASRITSYNVCYTKLLRELAHLQRPKGYCALGLPVVFHL